MFNNFYCNIELVSTDAKPPTRGTKESAGIDFYTPKDLIIPPNEDILVSLDIRVEIPKGYALVLLEKSGIATKKKLDIGAKLIDSDYRGVIHCHLINNSNKIQTFSKGDKICQGIIIPIWIGDVTIVNTIENNTIRGEGGFGSTGK